MSTDLRSYTRRVVRLMRRWKYNQKTGTWTHEHHPDLAVSTDMVALIISWTLTAEDESRQQEQEQAERLVAAAMKEGPR